MSVNHSARSGVILGISFSIFFILKVCCVFSLESPHTIYHFQYKKKHTLSCPKSTPMGFFHRDWRTSQNSHGKWAFSVWATEVLLYIHSCNLWGYIKDWNIVPYLARTIRDDPNLLARSHNTFLVSSKLPNPVLEINFYASVKHSLPGAEIDSKLTYLVAKIDGHIKASLAISTGSYQI